MALQTVCDCPDLNKDTRTAANSSSSLTSSPFIQKYKFDGLNSIKKEVRLLYNEKTGLRHWWMLHVQEFQAMVLQEAALKTAFHILSRIASTCGSSASITSPHLCVELDICVPDISLYAFELMAVLRQANSVFKSRRFSALHAYLVYNFRYRSLIGHSQK